MARTNHPAGATDEPEAKVNSPGDGESPTGGKPAAGSGLRKIMLLSMIALGVAYGDIGTSPLYALHACFHGPRSPEVSVANVLGVLSLIVWSLILVVSVKYLLFILRANNHGEGGILALMALLHPRSLSRAPRRAILIVYLGLFGAALLFGDGMITPAISVLSAVEGLEVATPIFEPYIVPITIVVLIALFSFQSRGTAKLGSLFGPVMIVWFLTLAVLGVSRIALHPDVLLAIGPHHAVRFFLENGFTAFLVMGSVILVLTGAEAMYADMGHFGATPIRISWFSLVLPALLLNYFGQGAWLIHNPESTTNPFYGIAPEWAIYPLVALSTMATVIASQALITGVFSLTMQAVQLGYMPRVQIDHTSETQFGQIYIAPMNWLMLVATIGLVLGFRTSGNLAGAYGVAVSTTMVITTLLFFALTVTVWKWNFFLAAALSGAFLVIDLAFFGANILKIVDGGWFPLVVAMGVFVPMITWKRGREILRDRFRSTQMPLKKFLELIAREKITRVSGTAVFMTGNPESVPLALLHNLKHNQVLHERVVVLTIAVEDEAHIDPAEHLDIRALPLGFHQVIAHYGFMEKPHVPRLLGDCGKQGLHFEIGRTTFFVGRETLLATKRQGMATWRERLFAIMSRNAFDATAFFSIPPGRVIEVGAQVEL